MSDYLPVGCYGKLPFWREYLEEKLSFPSTRALKEWVHQGREDARLSQEDVENARIQATTSRRFLFGIPGSTELVAGVIRPSSDGGGRGFPFMVFTHFPRRLYGKQYSMLPMALGPVWEALDDAWDQLAAVTSRDMFREVLGSSLVPTPAPATEVQGLYLTERRESASQVFRRQDGASLDSLKQHLPEFLQRLRKGGELPALELPVSDDIEASPFEVAFWLELINKPFFWKRWEPSIFLEESLAEKNRDVILIFGMIRPQDYSAILGCGGTTDLVRPAKVGGSPEGAVSVSGVELSFENLMKELSS